MYNEIQKCFDPFRWPLSLYAQSLPGETLSDLLIDKNVRERGILALPSLLSLEPRHTYVWLSAGSEPQQVHGLTQREGYGILRR